MKPRCLTLTSFETDLFRHYMNREKNAPVPLRLCSMIYRHVHEQEVYTAAPATPYARVAAVPAVAPLHPHKQII